MEFLLSISKYWWLWLYFWLIFLILGIFTPCNAEGKSSPPEWELVLNKVLLIISGIFGFIAVISFLTLFVEYML